MKETKRSRPLRLSSAAKEAHKQMMAGCWLEECKREGKKIVVGYGRGCDKNVEISQKPSRESGKLFFQTTLEMFGDRLKNNILSDDPLLLAHFRVKFDRFRNTF